jgi:predicted Fe-Mo cluster-binding NifX family protein
VDDQTGDVEILSNEGYRKGTGACHHIISLESRDVDTIVCARVGKRSRASLESAGFTVLETDRETVRDVVDAHRDGLLQEHAFRDRCRGHRRGRRRGRGHGRVIMDVNSDSAGRRTSRRGHTTADTSRGRADDGSKAPWGRRAESTELPRGHERARAPHGHR